MNAFVHLCRWEVRRLLRTGTARATLGLLFVAGLLALGGVIAMHRGLRGGRPAVALGAIVPGLMLVWSIVMPIVSLVIPVWVFAGRQPERARIPTD